MFANPKPVIGMLHVPALPGSPRSQAGFDEIRAFVTADAAALVSGGVDGLMIENFGDVPFYPRRVPAHTVAFLTALATEVRRLHAAIPLGINVLRNDGLSAIAVAAAVGARYVRVNVYTGARLADQGILEREAFEIARYRTVLGASVKIWADVAVKHSSAIGSGSLEDEAGDTIERGLADALIVTGAATGKATSLDDVLAVKRAVPGTRVLIGSGATASTVAELLTVADGVVVGSAVKRDGRVSEPVDPARVRDLCLAAR